MNSIKIRISEIAIKPKITKCWAICQLDQTGNAIFFMNKKPKDIENWICGIDRYDIIGMYIEDFNLIYGQNIPTYYEELEEMFGKVETDIDNFTYKPFQIVLPLFLDNDERHIYFGRSPI